MFSSPTAVSQSSIANRNAPSIAAATKPAPAPSKTLERSPDFHEVPPSPPIKARRITHQARTQIPMSLQRLDKRCERGRTTMHSSFCSTAGFDQPFQFQLFPFPHQDQRRLHPHPRSATPAHRRYCHPPAAPQPPPQAPPGAQPHPQSRPQPPEPPPAPARPPARWRAAARRGGRR